MKMLKADKCGLVIADASASGCSIPGRFNVRNVAFGWKRRAFNLINPNVKLRGAL